MAIDTAEKRASAAHAGFYFDGPGVTPDATPGVEWRQEAGWGYSGIAPDALAATGAASLLLLRAGSILFAFGVCLYG